MIYLIHSSVTIGGSGRAGARHYVGLTKEERLNTRMMEHLSGRSKVGVIKAFLENGGALTLVRTWPDGGPALEKYLKKSGHFSDLCPICRQESGKAPIRTPATLPMVSLPLLAMRSRKQRRASGGAPSRGKRIANTGQYLPGLLPEPTTSSPAVQEPVTASGGTPSSATARSSQPTGASAGTKQPSSSRGSTDTPSQSRRHPREVAR